MNSFYLENRLKLNLILLLLVFLQPICKAIYQLFFYGQLNGYEPNEFGYPKSLTEIWYNFIFVLLSLSVVVSLFRNSKLGWYLATSIISYLMIMLFLEEISLLSTFVGYFNWLFMVYFFLLGWILYLLYSSEIKSKFGVLENYWLSQGIFIVILFLFWFITRSDIFLK